MTAIRRLVWVVGRTLFAALIIPAIALLSALLGQDGARSALRGARRRIRRALHGTGDPLARPRTGPTLTSRVAQLEDDLQKLLGALHDGDVLPLKPDAGARDRCVVPVANALQRRGDALEAYALLADACAFDDVRPKHLRGLARRLHERGYIAKALDVVRRYAYRPSASGGDRLYLAMLEGDIAVLHGRFVPQVANCGPMVPVPGRVLHLVGTSLPDRQSGYTLRTHYIATAQLRAGLDPHVVTQMGFGTHDHDEDSGWPGTPDGTTVHVDGVLYHRVPGPRRGALPLDGWLASHVERTAAVVHDVRPAVLHAASDFINALTAEVIGRTLGVPVVYENRGFWEETWLSRQARTFRWHDLERLRTTHGLPDVYLWRRAIEDGLRSRADVVVTLADVMVDRIESGGTPRERVEVVPNAVDVEAFPELNRCEDLALQLGISPDTRVIGYISSLVEYEGIDTLLDAFAKVREASPVPVTLLVVGDGPERKKLLRQAAELGVDDTIFPGQVPHDAVLDYYSLIDIFVVPRKPAEVCHLVTPLKPFEAFATGRAVVLSDVRALRSIATDSQAAELFAAGDDASLAGVLVALLDDPQRCRSLADNGARWVREKRTWAANAQAYRRIYERLAPMSSTTPLQPCSPSGR